MSWDALKSLSPDEYHPAIATDGFREMLDRAAQGQKNRAAPGAVVAPSQLPWPQPLAVQQAAIPACLLSYRPNVIFQAPTGTGKTGTFLLSAMANCDPTIPTTQAVIIVADAVLAQMHWEAAGHLANAMNLTVSRHIGSSGGKRDARWDPKTYPKYDPTYPDDLEKDGTKSPGQLAIVNVDILNNWLKDPKRPHRKAWVKDVKFAVIDEADDYFTPRKNGADPTATLQTVVTKLSRASSGVQFVFCSATFSDVAMNKVTQMCLRPADTPRPVVAVKVFQPLNIRHMAVDMRVLQKEYCIGKIDDDIVLLPAGQPGALPVTRELFIGALVKAAGGVLNKVLLFVPEGISGADVQRHSQQIEQVTELRTRWAAGKQDRAQMFKDLKEFSKTDSEVDLLVANDILKRGYDCNNIRLVLQWCPTDSYELYAHRGGRTGRKGLRGNVITFVESTTDDANLGSINRELTRHTEFKYKHLPDAPEDAVQREGTIEEATRGLATALTDFAAELQKEADTETQETAVKSLFGYA